MNYINHVDQDWLSALFFHQDKPEMTEWLIEYGADYLSISRMNEYVTNVVVGEIYQAVPQQN